VTGIVYTPYAALVLLVFLN